MLTKQKILLLILLNLLSSKIIKDENHHIIKTRQLLGLQMVLGSTLFLLGNYELSSNPNEDTWKKNTNYSPMFYHIIKNKKLKELELLMFYMKTYTKDITNKCKIAIKKDLGNNKHYKNFILRCQIWGRFVLKNLPMSIYFFKPKYAFRNFYTLVKSGSLDFDELNEEKILEEEINEIFFNTISSEIAFSSEQSEKMTYIDFKVILDFYGQNFEKMFEDLLEKKEIQRTKIYLDKETRNYLDEYYKINKDIVDKEDKRIKDEIRSEPIDGFENSTCKNLYRYYQIGWLEPLFNFNSLLKFF